MITLFVIYLLSIGVSFGMILSTYIKDMQLYRYSFAEKIIGLLIVPILPIVNLVFAFYLVFGN